MDGERISLRLEPEDLEILDAFIKKHPEYSNRSNFARIAFRSFMERVEGTARTNNEVQDNVVPVKVPRFALNAIMDLVRAGVYNSPEDAIVECLRKRYTLTEEAVDTVLRAKLEAHKNTVQVLPD